MQRQATAEGFIELSAKTLELVRQNQIEKGDVMTLARIAGIQAAKKTGELIPLCHNLILNWVDVQMQLCENGMSAECTVHCIARTGAEMEALTAVSVALLTVYDMCKAVDKNMRIGKITLLEKTKKDAQ